MADVQRHRGPNDEGLYVSHDGRIGLANRRLAIRDTSPAGHMPMGSDDDKVWLTYNGELYNAMELRRELEVAGYAFRSTSDAEVILQGYRAWGDAVVSRLRGIFAFAIVDQTRPTDRRLFLARDRLGVKPLYYAHVGGTFTFASELKAVLASGLVERTTTPAAMVAYLLLGSVPTPQTMYRDIRALGPGHIFTLHCDRPELNRGPYQYWSVPSDLEDDCSWSDAVALVRASLEDAVHTELVSDVPLGAFLSGGLDSAAIVSLMRKVSHSTIRTCSMVFEESQYDEREHAQAVATAVGAEHYERTVTGADLIRELDKILWAMDQPTVDGINTYFVAQTAHEAGLSVALSGLGGDELFGGYANTFEGVPQMVRALDRFDRLPGGRTIARRAVQMSPRHHRLTKAVDALSRPVSPTSAYLSRRGLFTETEVRNLVGEDAWWDAAKSFSVLHYLDDRFSEGGRETLFQQRPFAWTTQMELETYTRNQLLRDTDAMSMAHSLEVRVPFLDHRLVEAVMRLPASVLRHGHGSKPLLRAAMKDIVPDSVLQRRGKQGFLFPFHEWLQPFRADMDRAGMATEPNSLNRQAVQQYWALHAAGKIHWSRPWALFVLSAWMARNTTALASPL